jgi:hypothetical protein
MSFLNPAGVVSTSYRFMESTHAACIDGGAEGMIDLPGAVAIFGALHNGGNVHERV